MGENGLLPGGEPSDRSGGGGGPSRRRRLILLGCLLLVLLAALPLVRRCAGPPTAPPPPWVFAACDVGQGDALFLAAGPHAAIAVDTGPDPDREDACARSLGITDVPLAILTHFHADHVDGLPGLVRGRRIGRIETTTVDDPPSGAALVTRVAAAAGIPVARVVPDAREALGGIAWHVLWPQAEHPLSAPAAADGGDGPGRERRTGMGGASGGASGGGGGSGSGGGPGRGMVEDGPGEDPGPNNDSIVMAVTIRAPGGPFRLLLTGDIETPVQRILLADRGSELRADVLKVPHHGSANQDPDFLAAVRPSVSVISVGAGNPYGHPAPRTVYLAGQDGARVYRTDQDGTVLISPPDTQDGAIPVRADRGDGTLPTAAPSPTGTGAGEGGGAGHGRSRHGGRHRHHTEQESGALWSWSPSGRPEEERAAAWSPSRRPEQEPAAAWSAWSPSAARLEQASGGMATARPPVFSPRVRPGI
jgi:beta-lactamase superfamily II metal-dependent hydrolase